MADKVRDIMLMSVPGLRDDGEDAFVDPDVLIRDDGMEGVFAKAYLRDEVPWFDLRHEVRDLMLLAVPTLEGYEELDFADQDIPDDMMEAAWCESPIVDVAEDSVEAVAETVTGNLMIGAPESVMLIGMPVEVQDDTEQEMVASETIGEDIQMAALVAEIVKREVERRASVMDVQDIDVPEVETIVEEVVEAEAETVVMQVPEPVEVPAPEDINVIGSPDEVVSETAEPEVHITEDSPVVRFSFGPQEVSGRGWRVCFSF